MRVAVIGGGVVGLTIAWQLSADHDVDLYDDAPGSGASYAAAGMLCPAGEAWYGEIDLLRLGLTSLRQWPYFAAELRAASATEVELRDSGTLLVGSDAADAADVDRLAELLAAEQVGVDVLSRRDARRIEPTLGSVRRIAHVSAELSVHNRQLLSALRTACERGGVRFHHERADPELADSRVVGVRGRFSDRVESADVTVIATGYELADIAGLPQPLADAVRPVKGQILRLRGAPELLRHTVRAVVRGSRVYAVPRVDGEIVVGASQEERDDYDTVTVDGVHRLMDDAISVLPALRECAVTELLARARPACPDNGPIIGATGVPGLVVAGGHHRGGVLLAPITAETVRAVLDGRSPPGVLEPFSPDRFTDRADHREGPCVST